MKKKLLFIAIVLSLSAQTAFAFTLLLPEPLSIPTATKIDIVNIRVNEAAKRLVVDYRFLSSTDEEIYVLSGRSTLRSWVCQDSAVTPVSTCFTDTFGYTIRQADVGKKLGNGLWQLIWSKMKPDVLKVVGNDIVNP